MYKYLSLALLLCGTVFSNDAPFRLGRNDKERKLFAESGKEDTRRAMNTPLGFKTADWARITKGSTLCST